jgi:hypothetical protein
MPKNCSAPVGKNQKLLLKVLNCLWNQYVSKRTVSTREFFANPNLDDVVIPNKYTSMRDELFAIVGLLNNLEAVKKLNVSDVPAYARLLAIGADGAVAVDTSKPFLDNTYANYIAGTINSNYATRKPIQELNVDECKVNSYQLKPAKATPTRGQPGNFWITEARVAERTGCAGVANTGFVAFSLEVNIDAFPFNVCADTSIGCGNF